MDTYSYRAILTKQTDSDRLLALFSASAIEIDNWVGIPQKTEFGTDASLTTSIGFQREVDPARLESLKSFYGETRNIIQNPLLCAARALREGKVTFREDASQITGLDAATTSGTLTLEVPDFTGLSLLGLLERVKQELEDRIPALRTHHVAEDRIQTAKELLSSHSPLSRELGDAQEDGSEDELATDGVTDATSAASMVFSEESHIYDFWEEISVRIGLLRESGCEQDVKEFLGYSRDALISFLRPVVLVDGQHRLVGAVESSVLSLSEEPYRREIEERIAGGEDEDIVRRSVLRQMARRLPISLMMNSSPAEHVFQFVVVNQKATPVGPALLGTIVSTSLSNEELETVSDRLIAAGIRLEQARAVAYLSRNPASPFEGRVERGLASDTGDQLQWSVLSHLVKICQYLKGGRLYHQRNDYADKWRRDHLTSSAIVSQWMDYQVDDAYAYWKLPGGPWRDLFIAFWSKIRAELATSEDPEAKNYWGSSRQSNLFNKVSLTILEADFFQFLCERRYGIDSVEQVSDRVDEWLEGVSRQYFAKDWNLTGVKKDSPGIRRQWARIWEQYRKDPQRLPSKSLYRQTS
jgi:hypothetical protein